MARGSVLLGGLDGDDAVDAVVSDDALVAAMLRVESALASAGARAGVVPGDAAQAIAAACAGLRPDPGALGGAARASGNPVVPLVELLVDAVPEPARPWVHRGATSQDVVDTALVLVLRDGGRAVLGHLRTAVEEAVRLAATHRSTPMVGRTLGQHAQPTTFGLVAAGWAAGLAAARDRLDGVLATRCAVQLGGAVGTLAAYGPAGAQVTALLAEELGLVDPGTPWHTERSRVHDLAAAFGGAVVAAGAVATDVVLGSSSDVAELRTGTGGSSSAMPHKHNPTDPVLVRSAAIRAPGLVATVLAAGLHDGQRATGAWHAEWAPLLELAHLAGGVASRTATTLAGLRVDAARMRSALDAAGPSLLSEQLAWALSPGLGRAGAREVVAAALAAATRRGAGEDQRAAVRGALLADPAVTAAMTTEGATAADVLDAALDPTPALEAAAALTDRTLERLAR